MWSLAFYIFSQFRSVLLNTIATVHLHMYIFLCVAKCPYEYSIHMSVYLHTCMYYHCVISTLAAKNDTLQCGNRRYDIINTRGNRAAESGNMHSLFPWCSWTEKGCAYLFASANLARCRTNMYLTDRQTYTYILRWN